MLESFFSRVQTRGPRSMMQPFAPASIRPLPPWLHRFNHLAWLPPAVLLALEIVLYIAPGEVILGGISWIPLASLLLTTVASEVVAALASLSFLDGGLPAALPMGAGMFAYGMSNFLASLALSGNHLDTASAISGLGLGMASLFSLAAAWETLSARGRHSMKPRRLSLLGAYGLVLLLVGAVAWAAHYGLFPHFFVMGTGNTLVELIVHIFALCAFLVSAGLLLASSRREHSDVLSWYALGLALIGVGLAGVFGYSFIDSLEAWVSRAAIYLGVAYLLTAMLVDMREGRHLSIPRAVLRETYGRYASLVETSADAVLLLADGICVFANPAAMKLFGSSSAQALLGASLRGQLLPDNNRMIEEEIHAMPGESRSSQAWQGKILMMDGQPVEVEGVHALVEYEGRHAVQVVLRDISERTRAERALRENEMRFRSVLDNSQDVIYRLNMQTSCYEYISPSAMTVVGFSADELIAMNMPTALSMVHPDDLPVMRAALARLEETGREEMEYRQLAKNGGWRWISNRVSLTLDAVGRPLYRDGNIRDITERKRAEEALEGANRQLRQKEAELREAHRIAHIGSWMWDAATDFTTGSDEMLRIFGLDPRTQTLPSFDRQRGLCYPVDDWERIEAAGRRAMKEGIDYEMDAQALRGGTPFWVCIRGEDVRDSEGRLIGLRGTVQDITARKQAEEALRLLNDQLEQKVQTRTAELAARAAQLRALASELAHTEQRERRRMAGIIHDHLQQLLVAAKFRVTVLGRAGDALVSQGAQEIETLLDNSLAEARSLTAELSPPILHEGGLLAGLDWLARWMADKHGLFVEQSVETTIPPLADDLKVLLFESTRELLFNAVKYSKARHAAVSVRALDGRLQLVVSDQGIGFDPRALKQAGSPGGGFGLFSIRERLSLVGGALEIDSAPGRGSRMVLSVPFVEPAGAKAVYAAAPPMASTGEAPPVTHPGAGLKVRVMLADDHLVLRQGLASLLAAEPDIAIVGEAADGQQAVSLACSLKPDVILMDMSMPRLNGVEATRIIHNDHPGIRIIGLSMFEDTERAQAMREAGAVSYLTKSGPVGDLIAAIRASMAGAPGVAGAPAPGRPAEES